MRWLLAFGFGLTVAGGAGGCIGPRPFACNEDSECSLHSDGLCRGNWCAYPDEDCPSGHRHEPDARDGLANQCITGPGETETGTGTGTGTGAGTGPDPGGDCESGCLCAASIVGGRNHTCVVSESGVHCWGDNQYRQLGPNHAAATSAQPIEIPVEGNVGGPAMVATDHNCIVATPGKEVRCWGRNDSGQTKEVTAGSSIPEPKLIDWAAEIPTVVSVLAAGTAHTCVADGLAVYCWGNVPGDQKAPPSHEMVHPFEQTTHAVAGLSAGSLHSCALFQHTQDGSDSVYCWGPPGDAVVGTSTPGGAVEGLPSAVTRVVGGQAHNCAVGEDRALYCWGSNERGQIGLGVTLETSSAQKVLDGPVLDVASGFMHTCAILDDGTLWCMGGNNFGQTQPGDPASEIRTPVQVDAGAVGASRFRAVATGERHTCAITGDGKLLCWGTNELSQLGDSTEFCAD